MEFSGREFSVGGKSPGENSPSEVFLGRELSGGENFLQNGREISRGGNLHRWESSTYLLHTSYLNEYWTVTFFLHIDTVIPT